MRRLVTVAACALLMSGCVYKGAKVIEGTDLTVGMEVPGSDGVAQLNVLNYLSGFRLAIAKNAEMACDYRTVWTNSYFGVVHTVGEKTIHATVTPVEVAPDGACRCGGECRCDPCKCADCKYAKKTD